MKIACAAAAAAILLGGCSSLATNPEYGTLTPIPAAPNENDKTNAIALELSRVTEKGNAYRKLGEELGDEDRGAGGFTLLSGFYGAAVTAFNPAVKNLQAAILAQDVASVWRSSLKPAERAKIFVQGYRALDCVHSSGAALLVDAKVGVVPVRSELDALREIAGDALTAALQDAAADKALVDRLKAVIIRIEAADRRLKTEEAAVVDAPFRIARVRLQIEDTIEKRLMAMAPDYAGALKIIGETKAPTSAKGVEKPADDGTRDVIASSIASWDAAVPVLETRLTALEARIPTRASDAYERMGECVTKLG
jgi:hypothetical protein